MTKINALRQADCLHLDIIPIISNSLRDFGSSHFETSLLFLKKVSTFLGEVHRQVHLYC